MIEWLDSLGISAYGKPAAPGVYIDASAGARRRSPPSDCASRRAARITASRSTSRWTSPLSPTSTRAAIRGLAVTQLADLGVATTVERRRRGARADPRRRICARHDDDDDTPRCRRRRNAAGVKHKGGAKTARIPHQDRRRPSG